MLRSGVCSISICIPSVLMLLSQVIIYGVGTGGGGPYGE